MSPKTQFKQNTIVDAAFKLAEKHGLSGITARKVAKELHSSVAPIYVNFSTIEDLVEAVVKRAFALSERMLEQQEGNTMFERIGKASLQFARQYPTLFRDLSIQPNPYMATYETIEARILEGLEDDPQLKDWTLKERKYLLLKMRVFHMGLSAMIANKHIPSWLDDSAMDDLLMEVGNDLLIAQDLKHKTNK